MPKNRKPRALGYVRVSTNGQAHGYGLSVQQQEIRSYAREQGWRLIDVVQDVGLSGTADAADRPGLAEVLSRLSDGDAEILVVPRIDRLARALHVQEAVLAEAWKLGAQVFTTDGGEVLQDDPDDPMRTFVRQVIGAVSQLERGMIRLRMMRGRREKQRQGGYAGGRPAFGYRAEGGALVERPEEQAVIAEARKLRAGGASLRGIAHELEQQGVRPRSGGRWHAITVSRIVGEA
jgi:DNA invertase Pin-like site-specific DNA recombinase